MRFGTVGFISLLLPAPKTQRSSEFVHRSAVKACEHGDDSSAVDNFMEFSNELAYFVWK